MQSQTDYQAQKLFYKMLKERQLRHVKPAMAAIIGTPEHGALAWASAEGYVKKIRSKRYKPKTGDPFGIAVYRYVSNLVV